MELYPSILEKAAFPLAEGADHAALFNNMAWILATARDARLRDLAVGLARWAVAAEPENARSWSTLGVALYRAGSFGECGGALEKSTELSSGGTPVDWFFVAMALHRFGHRDKALTWYEKGCAWILEQKSPQPEVEAWRDEARDLLGLAEATK